MGATKAINMLLNFREDTPERILDGVKRVVCNPESRLGTGYRHPCGSPTIKFYLDTDRPASYHKSDGTYYLRYCNIIKDYENEFEAWLESIAEYVIQVNGHHVGTMYHDGSAGDASDGDFKLISIKDGKVKYIKYVEECHDV